MYREEYQSGFFSVLYSIGRNPLESWAQKASHGHVKRVMDEDIQSSVIEIAGTNVSTAYINCPPDPKRGGLGIRLPYLVMIVKNMDMLFSFEVQVLDSKNTKRRFRASTFQSSTRVKPFICTLPMQMDKGWNQIQFNLADFTKQAYQTDYVETLHLQIHANCRLRRVFFSDKLYMDEELPADFKLLSPMRLKQGQKKKEVEKITKPV